MVDNNINVEQMTDKIVIQLTEDYNYICKLLDNCVIDRKDVIQSQKIALANYHAKIISIDNDYNSYNDNKSTDGTVDHNVLRHLRIEKDSEYYKKLENINKGNPEKIQQNIDEIIQLTSSHEVKPPPNFEEKALIRENMFNFLDETLMEETRLELEHEQAIAKNDIHLADEISEALFILQKEHNDKLNDMILEYKPSAGINKSWINDNDYKEMLKNISNLEDGAPGTYSSTTGGYGKVKKNKKHT